MKEEVERTRRWRRRWRGQGDEEERGEWEREEGEGGRKRRGGIKDERRGFRKKKFQYYFLCFSYRARVLILLCFIILKSFLKCPFRKRITKSKNGIQVFTLFKMTYIKKNLRSEYFFRTYSLDESTVGFYGTHCKKKFR